MPDEPETPGTSEEFDHMLSLVPTSLISTNTSPFVFSWSAIRSQLAAFGVTPTSPWTGAYQDVPELFTSLTALSIERVLGWGRNFSDFEADLGFHPLACDHILMVETDTTPVMIFQGNFDFAGLTEQWESIGYVATQSGLETEIWGLSPGIPPFGTDVKGWEAGTYASGGFRALAVLESGELIVAPDTNASAAVILQATEREASLLDLPGMDRLRPTLLPETVSAIYVTREALQPDQVEIFAFAPPETAQEVHDQFQLSDDTVGPMPEVAAGLLSVTAGTAGHIDKDEPAPERIDGLPLPVVRYAFQANSATDSAQIAKVFSHRWNSWITGFSLPDERDSFADFAELEVLSDPAVSNDLAVIDLIPTAAAGDWDAFSGRWDLPLLLARDEDNLVDPLEF